MKKLFNFAIFSLVLFVFGCVSEPTKICEIEKNSFITKDLVVLKAAMLSVAVNNPQALLQLRFSGHLGIVDRPNVRVRIITPSNDDTFTEFVFLNPDHGNGSFWVLTSSTVCSVQS